MLNGTVDQFECKLDNFLKSHLDQPYVEGCILDAVYLDGVRSKSLVDWIWKLGIIGWHGKYTMYEVL